MGRKIVPSLSLLYSPFLVFHFIIIIIIIIFIIIVAQSAKASERCSTPGRGGPRSHQHSRDHKCDYSSLPLLSLFNLSFFLKPHFLIYLVPIFLKFVLFFNIMCLHVVPSHALLWTARHRQDHHRTRHRPPALRVVIHFHPLLLIQF